MSISTQTRIEKIKSRLASLAPQKLEVIDESAKHHGHLGAQGGAGHYYLEIASSVFAGKSLMECHKMVYQALGDMMQHEIHALRIKTSAT